MQRVQLTLDIPMEAQAFFELYLSPPFEAFMAQRLGLATYREIERSVSGPGFHRKMLVIPKVQLPTPLRALVERWLPDGVLQYHESLCVDMVERRIEWSVIPPAFPDRQDIRGSLVVEPDEEDECLLRVEGQISVDLFGAGPLIARLAAQEFTSRYRRLPDYLEDWLNGQR